MANDVNMEAAPNDPSEFYSALRANEDFIRLPASFYSHWKDNIGNKFVLKDNNSIPDQILQNASESCKVSIVCEGKEVSEQITQSPSPRAIANDASMFIKTKSMIMDYESLPHFCKKEGSGSSKHSTTGSQNCYSLDHPFHQELYNYIKQQSRIHEAVEPIKQGSFHVDFPEPPAEEEEIAKTIESEINKFKGSSGDSDYNMAFKSMVIED